MPVPKEEFAAWFERAKARFAKAKSYPLIDAEVRKVGLLSDAYEYTTDNDAAREYLESSLVHAPNDIATRFVVLNYYYALSYFRWDGQEDDFADRRREFRRDLAFFCQT